MNRCRSSLVGVALVLSLAACQSTSGPLPASPAPEPGRAAATPGAATGARPGPYTAAQAARGEVTFQEACSSCHDTDRFSGAAFLATWTRAPISQLYMFIATNMPRGAVGSLSRQQYADIVAYLLALNDIPAGATDLPTDAASLRQIRIGAPPS